MSFQEIQHLQKVVRLYQDENKDLKEKIKELEEENNKKELKNGYLEAQLSHYEKK